MFKQKVHGVRTRTAVDEVEDWSGRFAVIGEGVGIMQVSNFDMRQHFPPAGWRATAHTTADDGTYETYTYEWAGLNNLDEELFGQ